MNQYEVYIGNITFYINANSEEPAKEQLALIVGRFKNGEMAYISGHRLANKYPCESMPKGLLQ